jgi:CheY-like chemotaxis protein/signal transduction histidine kinase
MPSVLLVDDEEVFLRNMAEYVRLRGWTVHCAANGGQALRVLESTSIDAMVLDRNMPEMSGDEVLRRIHSDPQHQKPCVVLLTAYGRVDNAVQALKWGAFEYLEKPLNDYPRLMSILAAGIVRNRMDRLRRDLLAVTDRRILFSMVRGILQDVLNPAKVSLAFLAPDGAIEDIVGTHSPSTKCEPREFVEEVRRTHQVLFVADPAEVGRLQPLHHDAEVLVAVPVPSEPIEFIGVLDLESTESSLDDNWREVLAFLADLIGTALGIIRRYELEHALATLELNHERERVDQMQLLYRELRHGIATYSQVISGQARELLTRELAEVPINRAATRRRLEIIDRNAQSLEQVTRDLRVASRNLELRSERIEVVSCLAEQLKALQLRLGAIRVESPPAQTIIVSGDAHWLGYCFQCLLENAIDAIEERKDLDPDWAATNPGLIQIVFGMVGRIVRLSIADDGIGFEPGKEEELFLPPYPTKPRPAEGKGEEVMGHVRIEEVLAALGPHIADAAEKMETLRPGAEIYIRERACTPAQVEMFVAQAPEIPDDSLKSLLERCVAKVEAKVAMPLTDSRRGAGLFTARRIVFGHGGELKARSAGLDDGVTVTMTLPMAQ